jgi:hypothetical protein
VDLVLVVAVVQHRVEMQFLHLRHGRDVAGHGLVDLDMFLALSLNRWPTLNGFLPSSTNNWCPSSPCPGRRGRCRACRRRIVDDLEDVGDDVPGGVGQGLDRRRVLPLSLWNDGGFASAGIGKQLLGDIQQFLIPTPLRAEQNRTGTRWPSRRHSSKAS